MDKKVISLSKRWGEGFALSQDAIDDCHVELINLGMESVGKGFAQKLDEFIFQGLLRETEYSETIAGLGALAETVKKLFHRSSCGVFPIFYFMIFQFRVDINVVRFFSRKSPLFS